MLDLIGRSRTEIAGPRASTTHRRTDPGISAVRRPIEGQSVGFGQSEGSPLEIWWTVVRRGREREGGERERLSVASVVTTQRWWWGERSLVGYGIVSGVPEPGNNTYARYFVSGDKLGDILGTTS